MTQQEELDLAYLKNKIKEKKISTFEYLVYVSRWTERDLEVSGYRGKTKAQAMEMIMASAMKDIKIMTDTHIKKYPD